MLAQEIPQGTKEIHE